VVAEPCILGRRPNKEESASPREVRDKAGPTWIEKPPWPPHHSRIPPFQCSIRGCSLRRPGSVRAAARNRAKQSQFAESRLTANRRLDRRLREEHADQTAAKTKPISLTGLLCARQDPVARASRPGVAPASCRRGILWRTRPGWLGRATVAGVTTSRIRMCKTKPIRGDRNHRKRPSEKRLCELCPEEATPKQSQFFGRALACRRSAGRNPRVGASLKPAPTATNPVRRSECSFSWGGWRDRMDTW
jgi:hypothetical protein